MTSWTDEAHSRLQGAGQRIGAARLAVIEYLDEQQCCRGAQEIHEALAARGSTVGLASVYRSLDGLVEQGLLQRVDFGDGIARYEPVRAGPRAPPPSRLRELRQGRDVPRRPARARDRGDRAADRLRRHLARRRPARRLRRLQAGVSGHGGNALLAWLRRGLMPLPGERAVTGRRTAHRRSPWLRSSRSSPRCPCSRRSCSSRRACSRRRRASTSC